MPHQCVRCGIIHDDNNSNILLTGCSCKGKLFFFVKKESLEEAQKAVENLTDKDKKEIEKDVLDLIDLDNKDDAVVLDLESINIKEPGKYELDLVNLFKKRPLVFKLEEGKYLIDIPESFRRIKH